MKAPEDGVTDFIRGSLREPVELSFLEQAARIHHQLVLIHPFENGNGRFSRFIADRYLLSWGLQYPQWPIEMQQNSPARTAYIYSLKQADRGDYTPLIDFINAHEARDPSLSEFLGFASFQKRLSSSQKLAIIKALIRMGKKVNETENNGHHPLHISIRKGLDAIALELIEENADIQFRDRSSFDPFELAISLGNLRIAHALHKAGYPYHKYNPCPPKLLAYYATLDEFKMMLE